MNQIVVKTCDRVKSRIAAVRRALTREFNYSTDFFFGLDFLMAAGGARFSSRNEALRRVWNVYRWLILLLAIVTFWNTFLHFKHRSRLEIVLNCLQATVCDVGAIARLLVLLWQFDSLMIVRKYVNQRTSGRNLQSSLEIRGGTFYRSRKLVTYGIGTVILFAASIPFIDVSGHHVYKLPFDVREVYPFVQTFCEKIFASLSLGFLFMISLNFLVIYMILEGLNAEGKVVAKLFSNIFNNTQQRVKRKLDSEVAPSRQNGFKENNYFWIYAQEEFANCVKIYAEFLAMKNNIRSLLNATFLIVYYSAVFSLASGAVYLSKVTNSLFTFHILTFCLWTAFECATLSRMVSLLTEVNESVGWEVYSLDWPTQLKYDAPFRAEFRSLRKSMLIVLKVSQQPLRLNCFGFFEFTQDRFYELLNMAYTLYTFFRDFV